MDEKKSIFPQLMVAIITLIAIGLVGVFGILGENKNYKKQVETYSSDLETYQNQLSDLRTNRLITNEENSEEHVQQVVNSAKEDGQKMVEYQEEFIQFMKSYEDRTDPEARDEMRERMPAMQQSLREAFGEDTSYAGLWYNGDSALVNYKWEFASTFDFTGKTANVVWICRDVDHPNDILAYLKGSYDSESRTFFNLVGRETSIGSKYYNYTVDEAGMYADETEFDMEEYGNKILEMANSVKVENPIPPVEYTPEESEALAELVAMRSAAKNAWESEHGGE